MPCTNGFGLLCRSRRLSGNFGSFQSRFNHEKYLRPEQREKSGDDNVDDYENDDHNDDFNEIPRLPFYLHKRWILSASLRR